MDRSAVAQLISESYTVDDYGVTQVAETAKTIYCQVNSVSMSEWFEGGRNGLNPELRIVMNSLDYSGEKIFKLNGTRYTVYRTYQTKNDNIELYVQREEGPGNAAPVPEPEPEPVTPTEPEEEPDGD